MESRLRQAGVIARGGAALGLVVLGAWTGAEARPSHRAARPAVDSSERSARRAPRPRAAPLSPTAGGTRPAGATVGLASLPMIPFSAKRGEYLAGYRLGLWPAEQRRIADPAYANPAGFIAVTPTSRTTPVSEHFTLGEFAMHDGTPDRPGITSYLVLRAPLVEKLELVLADLAARGVRARDFVILSGFRAPRYNASVEGSAPSSRHQFGDAADLIVDDDGDGRMDDLTGDGRVDLEDAQVVARAVERIEARRPALVGGLGLYPATGPRGPFLHIDVRGHQTRWGAGSEATEYAARRRARQNAMAASLERSIFGARPRRVPRKVAATGRCSATGASAVLCATRSELARRP
jgi:hypothetical protein